MSKDKIVVDVEVNDNASSKLNKISDNVKDVGREMNNMGYNLTPGLSKITNMAHTIQGAINTVNSATRSYNYSMSTFNHNVIRGLKEIGAQVVDFTTQSIENLSKFSEQHAKTLGAMSADYNNTSESQQKFFEDASKLKNQAMQYGMYGFSGNGSLSSIPDISQAQESLVKAGISADDIINTNVMKDVLTFAQGNELTTDQAVDTAVTLSNQFDIDPDKWADMLDKISHTADMSIVEVSDITTSLRWASGISAGLDRSLEETLAMLTVLGDFGLKGSQAGTGIQALLTRLLTGDTTVITQAQADVAPGNALKKFYEFEKIAKPNGNLLPMADIIDELNTTMEDMTDEEQAWFAKKLFGLYQMKSAYALLNGDDTDLNDVIDEIKKQSTGTNERKLNQLLDSQYGQLKSLNNLWDGIKTDVGDRLSPVVNAIRDELFNVLKNNGNYDINFDSVRDALEESCDLIEEQYGKAIADAVRSIGDITIDLAEVSESLAPEFGKGILEVFNSLLEGDIFGKDGAINDWQDMIENMKASTEGLPEELQDLGNAISETINWFGGLVTLNVASTIAELISSVLQILTIAGGAVINVAGAVWVNGTPGPGTGTGTGGTGAGGAGAGAAGKSKPKGTKGTSVADDVAKNADEAIDVADDVAKGIGNSVDDVAKGIGNSVDDVAKHSTKLGGAIGYLPSKLSGLGKALGLLSVGIEAYSAGSEAWEANKKGDDKGTAEAIGGGLGSIGGGYAGASGGALLGAKIGTLVSPGFGTIIGGGLGILGGVLGGIGGNKLGRMAGSQAYDSLQDAGKNALTTEQVNKTFNAGNITGRYPSINPLVSLVNGAPQLFSGNKNTNTNTSGDLQRLFKDIKSVTIESANTQLSSKNNPLLRDQSQQTPQINLGETLFKMLPRYNLTSNPTKDIIKNEIDNQVTINDNLTMQPRFNISAPNVSVNVKVDRNDRVTKQISILDPSYGTQIDNWYSRVSSQYGKKTKE